MNKKLIEAVKVIQENLKTQNNRSSEYPNFEVQTLRRKIVPKGYHDSCFLTNNYCEVEIHDFEVDIFGKITLGEEAKEEMEECELELDDMGIMYYCEEWETVQTCLTEAGAQAFIDRKSHDYGKMRIYGNSIYYNMEQRVIREFLMNLDLDGIDFDVKK